MKCRVKITQVLEGYVDLEVDRPEDAVALADDRYNLQGEELPDMDDCQPLQFSVEEILHQHSSDINNVFLVPDGSQFWSAAVAAQPPTDHAVLLTAEQSYPAEIFYERMDLNGSGITDGYICHDRNELLETLNWIGQCGHTPLSLWSFDIDKPIEEDLQKLLEDAYKKKCSLIQSIDWEQAETNEHEKDRPGLQEKLSAAQDAAKKQDSFNHTDGQENER